MYGVHSKEKEQEKGHTKYCVCTLYDVLCWSARGQSTGGAELTAYCGLGGLRACLQDNSADEVAQGLTHQPPSHPLDYFSRIGCAHEDQA